jgi:3',5'-nucleoside bisphosphate phosphatase
MYVSTDLHGHTLFSDGRATPESYVDFRREHGMRVVAITDHDVFAGAHRGASAAARAGMYFLPAAEITAFLHFGTSKAEQFHVLAYFSPGYFMGRRLEETFLFKRGQRIQAKWKEFVLEWLDGRTEEERRALDPEGRLATCPADEFPALQSMIDSIVQKRRELFEPFRDNHVRFWEEGREFFGWTPEECIDQIRADGAIDIVAHPGRYRDKERTREVLTRATGLEVYTSRHREDVAAEFRRFAEENRKLWTASSDDHQNARYMKPPCGTPVSTVERLLRQALPLSMILAA